MLEEAQMPMKAVLCLNEATLTTTINPEMPAYL